MGFPVQLIRIFAEQTQPEPIGCKECRGLGEVQVYSEECGMDLWECDFCCGSGMNQLGWILSGILNPPPEGYGPVELKEALRQYLLEK